ncbi:MAG: GGDEF domain-containing protein [Patulibacter minatonensis]
MSRFAPTLGIGVSRRDIALSPIVWLIVGLTFGTFAVALCVIPYALPETDATRLQLCGAFLAVCSLVLLRMRPPEPDAPATHAVLALTYIGPMFAILAFAPDGALPLGSALFIGPLTSVWMGSRRQAVQHLSAASFLLCLPAILGVVDTPTVAAVAFMVPSMWALWACCLLVLETAEAQGAQLTALVKRDPLTGLGNRRLLDEQLETELGRHRSTGRQLTVLALDLNGFKALNDTVGHAAGDELLKDTARQLEACARKHDTIVRQGGDEFCLLLPDTSAAEAEVVIGMIRRRLREVSTFGMAISTGVGLATFPSDGQTAEELLGEADARLRVDKLSAPSRGVASATTSAGGTFTAAATPDTPADPDLADHAPGMLDGLTRKEMAASPALWRATGMMFLFYPLVGLVFYVVAPSLRTGAFLPVCLAGLALSATIFLTRPARIGTLRNHATVAAVTLFPVLALVATKPAGAATIGLATWIGPVAAVRLRSRWHVAAHWTAATWIILALPLLGLVKASTLVALLMLVGTVWVLGACCVLVLEAAEAQGEELARMVRRDPLTGAGNRRALHERLTLELAHHRLAGAQLTVLALDLNGFKALNDSVGHAAGDELLRTVARELATIVDGRGDVVRQGGDEFAVLLPWCSAVEAQGVMAAVRTRLGEIVVAGVPVSTGVGAATFPTDGIDVEGLLDRADNRLRSDKYGTEVSAEPRAARLDASGNGRTMSVGPADWTMADLFGRSM